MTLNLTNAGINVLFRALSGESILFTRVQIGNGAAKSPGAATELSNPLLTLDINSITVGDANATLSTSFNNNTITSGFRHTETGIFVQSQTDSNQEILYAYGSEPEATANYISSAEDNILETQLDILVFVGESKNVAAAINESLIYASAAALKEHTENRSNPHLVKKDQVGLGNVPNVATNDQTPTFTESNTLEPLASGSKMSSLMGRIAKGVSSLIAHLSNTKNPHSVTAKQIGAAESSHSHTTSDLNSGTLGVARGGTGKGFWAANRILYANSTTALTQMGFPASNNSVLRQDQSGAPYWGATADVESGTYIGNGENGELDKNSLVFSKGCPSLVFITREDAVAFATLFPAFGYYLVNIAGTWTMGFATYEVSTKTTGWWSIAGAAVQMNEENAKYNYVSIG